MPARTFTLTVLAGAFAVCRLTPEAAIPQWASVGRFFSITRTPEELSIICPAAHVPADVPATTGWRCLKVEGPFAFTETGVLRALAEPLAKADISMLAVATYDTDYLLVQEQQFENALLALAAEGHTIDWESAESQASSSDTKD